MAVDLSYRPAHLPGAASTGSDSKTLQIANVAFNNKWTKRRSFSNSFKPSESAAARSWFCSFFTSINHKLHAGSTVEAVTGTFIYAAHFITSELNVLHFKVQHLVKSSSSSLRPSD